MSHSFWYNDEHMAGPSYNVSTRLSFEVSDPTYKIGLPGHQDPLSHTQPSECSMTHALKRSRSCIDTDFAGQYVIRPHFDFPGYDDAAMQKMHQFHDRFRNDTHSDQQSNSTILADSPSRSSAGELDVYLSGGPNFLSRTQHNALHNIRDTAVQLPLYHREATSSFFSYRCVTPNKLTGSSSPPRAVTAAFEETDETHSVEVRPQSLSPYSPMPLQPIFHLEPQSKAIHDTIEPIPHVHLPPCDSEGTKSPPIDPLLVLPHEGALDRMDVSFGRGSIAPQGLWPPSFLGSDSPVSNHHDFCLPTPIGIPLEIAKHYAQELRVSSPYAQLSQQFLLSFMGQSTGNMPWSCYIRGCGKQLTRKSHMVDHIRMHLDERVYACEYCPQTFLRKADCKRHSVAHNPDKAFQCDFCDKSFGRRDLLTRHKRKCESNCSRSGGRTAGTKGLSTRKRKGVLGNSVLDAHGTQNVYVAGSLFSIPPEHHKRTNHGFILENDGNKENIPPSPEERLRKKARVLF